MQFINALSVLFALIGLAMVSVGWFITFFTALLQRRWLAVLLALTLILSPVAAKKLTLHYAFWLLIAGFCLFIACLLVSEWVNPRFFWFA